MRLSCISFTAFVRNPYSLRRFTTAGAFVEDTSNTATFPRVGSVDIFCVLRFTWNDLGFAALRSGIQLRGCMRPNGAWGQGLRSRVVQLVADCFAILPPFSLVRDL